MLLELFFSTARLLLDPDQEKKVSHARHVRPHLCLRRRVEGQNLVVIGEAFDQLANAFTSVDRVGHWPIFQLCEDVRNLRAEVLQDSAADHETSRIRPRWQDCSLTPALQQL